MPIKTLKQVEPEPYSPCPCGSGRKFKFCCSKKYAKADLKSVYAKLDAWAPDEALSLCRRYWTWYYLAHRAHTRRGTHLYDIDCKAFAEIATALRWCYINSHIGEQWINALDVMESAIDHSDWNAFIRAERSFYYLGIVPDEIKAESEFAGFQYEKCEDPKTLGVYVEACYSSLDLETRRCVVEHMLKHAKDEGIILQFSFLRGELRWLVGELAAGTAILEQALNRYRSNELKERSFFGDRLYANGLHILGLLKGDPDLTRQSIEKHEELLEIPALLPNHRAEFNETLADCYFSLGDDKRALDAYGRAFADAPSEIVRIFSSRISISRGDIDGARSLLQSIKKAELSAANFYDLCVSFALLSIKSGIALDIETARQLMKQSKIKEPFWVQRLQSLEIEMLEVNSSDTKKPYLILEKLNEYAHLKPNIFGLGINLNSIVNDILSYKKRRKQ